MNSTGTTLYLSYNFQTSVNNDSRIQMWVGSTTYSAASTTTIVNPASGSQAFPDGLATDTNGNVYIADASTANEAIAYNSSLSTPATAIGANNGGSAASAGKLFEASDVAVDAGGHVYVAGNTANDTVQTFNGFANLFTAITQWAVAAGHSFPNIAVNSAGTTVFVAPLSNGPNIYLYTATGTLITTWTASGVGSSPMAPAGLAVAPTGSPNAGHLYVTDTANAQVVEFDATGNVVGTWGSSGTSAGHFTTPSGIGVDNAGNIYVADWGDGLVQKFAPR